MKFLFISLHYGEDGSGGARRPTLLAGALRDLGHEVVVVTASGREALSDSSEMHGAEARDGVIRVKHPVAHRRGARGSVRPVATTIPSPVERVRAPLRRWLLWPEPEIRWTRRALARLRESPPTDVDWVLTTSPPESLHLVGARLAEELGARWVADFRDSWTARPHRAHVRGLRARLEQRTARRWLSRADAVVAVDAFVMAEVGAYAGARVPCAVIGHFSEPFTGIPTALPPDAFHLVHTGGFALSDRRRDLEPLLQRLSGSRADLHLHVAGPLTQREVQALDSAEVACTHHGVLPRSASLALQAGADALLLYTPETTDALPGKYAEYALAGKPIVYEGSADILARVHSPVVSIGELSGLRRGESRVPGGFRASEAACDLLALLARA